MCTENSNETRVRMNLAANAKGMYQMDVTVESSTVEESKAKLAEAIDAVNPRYNGVVMIIKIAIVLIVTFLLSTFFKMIISDFCKKRGPGDTPMCIVVLLTLCGSYIGLMILLIRLLFIL